MSGKQKSIGITKTSLKSEKSTGIIKNEKKKKRKEKKLKMLAHIRKTE